jgi:hypothetical protein
VKIVASNRGVGARDLGLSVPEFDDLRSRAGVFDQVTADGSGGADHPPGLSQRGEPPLWTECFALFYDLLG